MIYRLLTEVDQFKTPIALTYANGKTHFSSKMGGLVSLLIYATIFAFTVGLFAKLINRQDPTIFEVKTGVDLSVPSTEFVIQDNF